MSSPTAPSVAELAEQPCPVPPHATQATLSTKGTPCLDEKTGGVSTQAPDDTGESLHTVPNDPPDPAPHPYSSFSPGIKWVVAGLGGISAIFSPISVRTPTPNLTQSNIFVPAIPTIAAAFHRSLGDISLAVTVYLIFQAVTPSFFGAASDSYGRRPIWLLTMSIYLGGCIGLALCPTSAFWALLLLRAVQSTGGR